MTKKGTHSDERAPFFNISNIYYSSIAACAEARRAIGTRNGEQDT